MAIAKAIAALGTAGVLALATPSWTAAAHQPRDFDGDGTIRIGCAGDSNTDARASSWVAEAAALRSHGPAATATGVADEPVAWVNAGVGLSGCPNGLFQIQYLVDHHADIVIVAFGTNDVKVEGYGRTPRDVLECYQRLQQQVAGRQFIVATTPPVFMADADASAASNARIDELNRLVRANFAHVAEFHDGFTRDLFADDLHLNPAGHRLRAQRALEAIDAL